MDAAYRSTQSPFAGASPTQLVSGKLAPEHAANRAAKAHEKDQVLAAALSEYCRLREDGSAPQVHEFCRRFPTYHKSVQRMIDVEETLGKLDDLDDAQWPEVGTSFMGFDVLHELGVGAFARVYLASEPALGGRLVAVKVAMYGSDEAETLGKLDHPNVVPVHSVRDDPDSGMTAVCMPYLGSCTLSDVIEQVFQEGVPEQGQTILEAVACREIVGDIDGLSGEKADSALRRGSYVDAVVRLGIQMAEALVYTHAHGVLHRDLKPSNVLITPTGQPKLLDFNLSCDAETEVNRLGGTLPYMPPEQINDVFLRPFDAKPPTDVRSDIFSLGVILYELFTGELPFGNPPANIQPTEAGEIYLQAQQSPPRPIHELNPAIESQTARLIERCIAPNPDCRPADAATLVAELGHHFSPTRQLRRWSMTQMITLVAVGFVALAMMMSLALHLKNRPSLDRRMYDLALKAKARGDFFQAIEYLDQAHELNEDEPAIRFARGLCNRARGDHMLARRDFLPISHGDCDRIVKEVYAYSHLETDSPESSQAALPYAELVQQFPDDIEMRVHLAFASYCLVKMGRSPGKALAQSKEILKMDPTCQAAHHLRAMCTYQYFVTYERGDIVDVLQDVETALAMGPSNPDLEKKRMLLLTWIAEDDPNLNAALAVETKARLWQMAPDVERPAIDSLQTRLNSIADDQWFDAVKQRCRKTPERRLMSYITNPPSETEIRQFLARQWK